MSNDNIFHQIENDIKNNDVVVYMKGTKHQPQCGFSATVVTILEKCEVDFKDINVLADSELRQGIKDFSDWPTIPQIYIDGVFVGGCDIMKEMYQSGELQELLNSKTKK